MTIAFCIAFILIGLFLVTPTGAAVGLRWNQKHEDDTFKGSGYRARSLAGVKITGVIFIAFAAFVLVKNF